MTCALLHTSVNHSVYVYSIYEALSVRVLASSCVSAGLTFQLAWPMCYTFVCLDWYAAAQQLLSEYWQCVYQGDMFSHMSAPLWAHNWTAEQSVALNEY